MEVNSKQPRSHLSCLSGSSQQSLIGNDNGSERSTPISVHSMSSVMPDKAQRQLDTPILLGSAPLGLQGNIFFSAGSTNHHASHHHHHFQLQQQQQQQQQSSCNKTQTALDANIALSFSKKRSPKSADINMNAENERNRETASNQTSASNISISPNPARFPKPRNSTTPSLTPTTFVGFFPELPGSSNLPHQPPVRRSINMTTAQAPATNTTSTSNVDWLQQDDNYHLYHEPLDPEDQKQQTPSTAGSYSGEPEMRISTPKIANNQQRSPSDAKNPNMVTNNNTANSTGTNTAINNKDWPFAIPNTPNINKSPTIIANNENISSPNSVKTASTSFADRAEPSSSRNDVSADIYSCYVTRKSNERAKHRSRSYHGPKNSTLQNQAQQPLHNGEVSRNLSSTSIADLPISPSTFASLMVPIHFRDHCVRELIETESNYLHALNMIINSFSKPLEPLLRREDNQIIFGHIKYFHHIHSSFQTDLVKAAMRSYSRDVASITSPALRSTSLTVNSRQQTSSNPSTPTAVTNIPQPFLATSPLLSPTAQDLPMSSPLSASSKSFGNSFKISSCFLNFKEKFLKYGEYCATLSKAQAHLDELSNRNEAIAAQLDRCQQDANQGKFKLRDLLSLPMQRILKYHLLLAQLIKNTSSTNDDYHGLKRAYEAMVDLGQYINEVKRDTEAIQIINDIEQSITGLNMPPNTQLTDYGRLVADEELRIRMPNEIKAKPMQDTKIKLPHDVKIRQKRYVFVFDKVMLICKQSGLRGFQYKEALVLSEFDIDANSSNDMISKHTAKEKWSYNFNLVRSYDEMTYSFYARTLEVKNKFVEAILKAMDNIRPVACRNNDTNHEFLMHTFDKASYCDHCGKLLLGLYYQGYRCRSCFTSAHKKCLAALKHCGPSLPPRPNNSGTLSHSRPRCNEPPSPSIRSNCSDDSHNMFMHFPTSNSSSTQCVDVVSKNEYSNIDGKTESSINPSSSFRENGSTPALVAHRPVSSMINVSLQNSTNHLLQQRALLKESSSTPSMVQQPGLKAKAISDYTGREEAGHLQIRAGDIILVHRTSVEQIPISPDDAEHRMVQLSLNQIPTGKLLNENISWWMGRNARTNREGRFPSNVVKIFDDSDRFQSEKDETDTSSKLNNLSIHSQTGSNHVNFILKDKPWFCGRMDRDEAQALLENMPHGTFLVRVSTKHDGSYVISLNYSNQVKHMRIYVSKDNQLYLSQNRYFKSVTDLVSWYEKNSLVESFHMLDARFTIPYKLA